MIGPITRPFLPQNNGAMIIRAYQVERILADIDADDRDFFSDSKDMTRAPSVCRPRDEIYPEGLEHGRAIPLAWRARLTATQLSIRREPIGCSEIS
jgi:hypothetical protein